MNRNSTVMKIIEQKKVEDSYAYWMSKTPEERVEAVETIRDHYYSMLGYTEPPRIKKIIRLI